MKADVVVLLLRTVYHPFDRIAVIVDHKDNWLEAEAHERTRLLDGHLERSVTNDQDDSTRPLQFLCSDASAKSRWDGEPDRGPEDLGVEADICGEYCVSYAELGRANFGKQNVVGLEEASNALSQVILRDWA